MIFILFIPNEHFSAYSPSFQRSMMTFLITHLNSPSNSRDVSWWVILKGFHFKLNRGSLRKCSKVPQLMSTHFCPQFWLFQRLPALAGPTCTVSSLIKVTLCYFSMSSMWTCLVTLQSTPMLMEEHHKVAFHTTREKPEMKTRENKSGTSNHFGSLKPCGTSAWCFGPDHS